MSLPLKPSPTLEYAYDDVGNISSYKKNGSVYESYTYDALNQLTGMTRGGTTWGYTYDNAGNLLSQTENGVVTRSYTYGDPQWKDRLTAFNGNPITYDEIGNPIAFYNGFVFTWENGRQLQRVQNGQNYYTYTYDGAGRRTSKNVNGTVTEFFWVGDTLQAQKTGNEYLIFLYDESGIPYGFLLKEGAKEEYYYYVYNLQGDVTGILNSAGTQVVEYIYSPYGEIIGQNGPMADTIGRKNRLTYRGYYHDGETNFYYLKSRYYAPILGRFLNADSVIASASESVQGHNLYAYCFNNPINMSDDAGSWPDWAKKLAAAVAVGAAKGAAVGFAVGATTGAAGGAVSHRVSTGSWNGAGEAALNGMADGALSGSISGTITGGITGGLSYNSGARAPSTGKGFAKFEQLKKEIGSPGAGNQWHHIVEQSQIAKSGFSPQMIHNTNNIVAVSKTVHQAISGYYSSVQPFTNGMIVRNWLAGQSFSAQYEFGLGVIDMFI